MNSPPGGLSTSEAQTRLAEFGSNAIQSASPPSAARIIAQQFTSPLVWLLLGACLVAALVGEAADAIAIMAIVLINAAVGFVQEYRAEQAVRALRAMTAPRARVRRDGVQCLVAATEVVPGDLLLLEAGDVVAADASLEEAHALTVNEAPLTGESAPVDKMTGPVAPERPLAERAGEVFMGTAVVSGTGSARVVATGMQTQLGRVANLLVTAEKDESPLQGRLRRVSGVLLWVCLAIVGLVAWLGISRGLAMAEVFLGAVSLAVAAVPEGLPAVITIALAAGVQRMAARRVLVRRLLAVEALGCTTVICTDKTGTLTTGVMTVRELWGDDHVRMLDAAAACCDAELGVDARAGVGDSTEVALLVAAAERRIFREDIERSRPRTAVLPFDSKRKWMGIQRSDGVLYVKGAPEAVIGMCEERHHHALTAAAEMSSRGLRVLAVATGRHGNERPLELLGLVGLADPPRTEAIDALRTARRAGIRTVMITGDHPATAAAIGRELGLIGPREDPAGRIHARATPEDKLRIVREWKSQGAVVAMTGDGVNDAPALREAHIGIAMGKSGTEVTREAADVVLADDNFASLVAGIEEGRGIFENLRKTLVYLLSGNLGELMLMLFAALLGLPTPLLPLHLLWVNLVTDGLPALALVTDPIPVDTMAQAPRNPVEPILGRSQWATIMLTGLLQAGISIAVFAWALQYRDLTEARNLAFSTLVVGELLRAFAARHATLTFWQLGLFSNVRLVGIVMFSLLMQLGLHHIPAAEALFQIAPLSAADCFLSFVCGAVPFVIIESAKVIRGRLGKAGDACRA